MIVLRKFKSKPLAPVKSKRIPAIWLVTDTETTARTDSKGEAQRFKLGWVCTWIVGADAQTISQDWQHFIDEVEYCKHIHDQAMKYGRVMLVGHNIFFDLQGSGFFEYFRRWGWDLKFYYDRGLTYLLKCTREGADLTAASTTNWYDCSLASLGKLINLYKFQINFENASTSSLLRYCKRDTEILVRAMSYYLQFISVNDLGPFCLTKASQAFAAYRHRFMDRQILIHNDTEVSELERAAYMGGRVECFFLGHCHGGPFVSLDINAMYPYVMDKYEYPCRLVDYQTNYLPDHYLQILDRFAVVCEAELQTEEPIYAVRIKKRVIFPVGRFRAFLCTEGLRRALKAGHVVKIIRVAVYQKAKLFGPYVQGIADLREQYNKQKNKIMVKLCKYLHNSLYGKFAQKNIVTELADNDTAQRYFREEIIDLVAGGVVTRTFMMNKIIVQYDQGEAPNSFTAIAAHITENGRLALWDIISGVGRSRVLYCDTDSVKIREKDLQYVRWPVHQTRMGALKVEETCRKLVISGAKNYRTNTHRVIKGIPKSAVEISPGTFEYTTFHRQVSHLRDGQIVGAKVFTTTRTLKAPYRKGIVHDDGTVTPYRLPDAGELPLI